MNGQSNPQPDPTPPNQGDQTPPSGFDPAINVTNTYASGKTEVDKKINPNSPVHEEKKEEEVKDLFEEGLEFEPEPEKVPQEPASMKDIKPVAPAKEEEKPLPPVEQQKEPFDSAQGGVDKSVIPPEDKEVLNKIQDVTPPYESPQPTFTSEQQGVGEPSGGFQAPGTQDYPQQPPAASMPPPPPRKRSFCGLIIAAAVLILLLGGGGYAYFTFFAKVALTITFNTEDVELLIDSKDYSSQITNSQIKLSLSSGNHKFEVSKEDYFAYDKSWNVSGIPNKKLEVNLRPHPEPTQVLQYPSSDISLNKDGSYLYYKSNGGKTIYRIKIEKGEGGEAEAITPDTMAGVSKIIWAPDYSLAILKVIQGSNIAGTPFAGQSAPPNTEMAFLYDFAGFDKAKQTAKFLGGDIGDVVWLDTNKIYFVQGQNVLKSDKAFGDIKTIWGFSDQAFENPKIYLPKNEKFIALIPQSSDYSVNDIMLFNMETNEVSEITEDGGKLSALFNEDDNLLLFSTISVENQSKEQLDLYLLETQKINEIKIAAKLSKSCFLDPSTILYAVYNESSKSDSLESLSILDESKVEYTYKGKDVSFSSIFFSSSDEYIYFLNGNLIYSLKLDEGEY